MTDGEALKALLGGMVAGRYRLLRLLGEGGFGWTFLSEQVFLGEKARDVAVKISKAAGLTEATVRKDFADAFHIARVFDQMLDRSAAGHLVQVFDVGIDSELGGRAYMVSEFIRGESLRDRYASFSGPIPEELVVKWSTGVAAALAAMHGLSPPLLHRDLKPENVLLGMDNHIRLIDFGLAANLIGAGVVGGAAGTTLYMSPETLIGESTAASDVYSLGVMMYEGLTGSLPFADLIPPPGPSDAQNRWTHAQKKGLLPPSVRARAPLVSASLDTVVQRCLEFTPGRRFLNARQLHEALGAIDSGSPGSVESNGWTKVVERARLQAVSDASAGFQLLKQELSARRQHVGPDPRGLFEVLRAAAELAAGSPDLRREASDLYREAWELVQTRPSLLPSLRGRMTLVRRLAESYAEHDPRRLPYERTAKQLKEALERGA